MATFGYLRQLQDVNKSVLRTIQEVIGVPRIRNGKELWVVLQDSIPEEGLYIVHHTDHVTKVNRRIRGLIVDVIRKVLVVDSFGHNPVVIQDEIPDRSQQFTAKDGQIVDLAETDNRFHLGLPGVMIRVFLHNGNVYFSSYKSVDVFESRGAYNGYRYSDAIRDYQPLFDRLKGEYDGTGVFGLNNQGDGNVKYSPFVHYFMLMLEPYFGSSRMHPIFASIVYLRTSDVRKYTINQVYEQNTETAALFDGFPEELVVPYPENQGISFISLLREQQTDLMKTTYFLDLSEPILPADAQVYLSYGFTNMTDNDEFIMIYRYDKSTGKFVDTIRMNSTLYETRDTIRGNSTNTTLRFFELLDYTRQSKKRYHFTSRGVQKVKWRREDLDQPLLNFKLEESTVEQYIDAAEEAKPIPFVLWPTFEDGDENEVFQAWANLLYGLNYYDRFNENQDTQRAVYLFDFYFTITDQLYWLYLRPSYWKALKDNEGYEGSLYHFFNTVNEAKTNKKRGFISKVMSETAGHVLYRFSNIVLRDYREQVDMFVRQNFDLIGEEILSGVDVEEAVDFFDDPDNTGRLIQATRNVRKNRRTKRA